MLPFHVYQLIFAKSPIPECLIDPAFIILDANDAFLKVTQCAREALVGRDVFDVFPDDPAQPAPSGSSALRASLRRVLETGQPDALPMQRYPIPLEQPDGTRKFEERSWNALNTPLFDDAGHIVCIAHSTIDVTNLKLQEADGLTRLQAAMFSRTQTLQEVNKAMSAERRRLWHLFQNAPGFVYFTREPRHIIEQANKAFLELTGGREVIGLPMERAIPEFAGQNILELHDAVYLTGEPYIAHRLPVEFARSDGARTPHVLDVVFQPIVDEHGRVTGICGQGVDVTDRVRAADELKAVARRQAFRLELSDRLRAIEGPDEIVACASEVLGRGLGASRVAYCEVDESSGRFHIRSDWTDPMGPVQPIAGSTHRLDEFGARVVALLRAGETLRVDDVRSDARTRDNLSAYERLHVGATVSVPLVKAGRMVVVLSVQHAQPHAWSEDELEMCTDTAERTWAAVENARVQEELREANRRKDEFLAMLAHELRNPLAPISAAAQLMQLGRLDEHRLRQTSQVISRQVAHMTGLVDDLLDVSRVTRGLVTLNRSPQDMKTVVGNAVEQVRPLVEKHQHTLDIDMPGPPAQVMGDPKRLVQIVTNLVNNAAKYTQPGGRIQLRLETDDTHVTVRVTDNGIGIAPHMQKQVFELFAQAERTPDRSQGGLGLGLALVRSLVELHGGDVACTSAGIGHGSAFVVRLPKLTLPGAQRERRSSSRALDASSRRYKVLVVDDNTDAADMLSMLLQTVGHDVVVAHAGAEALNAARSVHPDICLLDIGLPDMDGNELARRLRAMPEAAHAKLIAITGYGQDQDRRAALASGFDHHLVKPVDPGKLMALLRAHAVAA